MDFKGTQATWLGHGTYSFKTTEGKVVLVDPWTNGNPACPDELKNPESVDLVLITHGHTDHIGDAVELCTRLAPDTYAIIETGVWLTSKGVPNVTGFNMGGTIEAHGVRFTMVNAAHSNGIDDGGQIIYGGDPAGFVIEFPGGLKVYYAGDTAAFSDMRIIGELHAPDVSFLPMGDFYTMGPREAAYAIKLLGAKAVVPMHYGTFPVLTGTPDQLRKLVDDDVEVIEIKPGDTLS